MDSSLGLIHVQIENERSATKWLMTEDGAPQNLESEWCSILS